MNPVKLSAALGLTIFMVANGFEAANAQSDQWSNKTCPKSWYSENPKGCFHRDVLAVFQGCKRLDSSCPSEYPPVKYTTATPSQVNNAIVCDIAKAVKQTKGNKGVDLSLATISMELTFSLVTKNSSGVSLSVPAIPIFGAAASVAPSVSAAGITSETTQTTNAFAVDPIQLQTCPYSSERNWLTSNAVLGSLPPGQTPVKIQQAISFIVSKQNSAGLKLNIIPVAIGPQFSTETNKTQKICVVFDFAKPQVKPGEAKTSCPAAPGGSGANPA